MTPLPRGETELCWSTRGWDNASAPWTSAGTWLADEHRIAVSASRFYSDMDPHWRIGMCYATTVDFPVAGGAMRSVAG